MASLDDYDEFGNYIGADLDSDDEDEMPQNPFMSAPSGAGAEPTRLEGYDDEDEPMPAQEENALMEVDGECLKITVGVLHRLISVVCVVFFWDALVRFDIVLMDWVFAKRQFFGHTYRTGA